MGERKNTRTSSRAKRMTAWRAKGSHRPLASERCPAIEAWLAVESVVYLRVLSDPEKRRDVMYLRNTVIKLVLPLGLLAIALAATGNGQAGTIKGYVLDSACAFTKNLKKPVSPECAVACAKAGSPLVILSDDGTIYWPIADATPSSCQNDKLLPF